MAINYNGTVIDKITYNGVEVSSGFPKQSFEMSASQLKEGGNTYPFAVEKVVTAKPKAIFLSCSTERTTRANTLQQGVVYGSTNNGGTWEELGKVEKTNNQQWETLQQVFVINSGKTYNKFKVEVKQSSDYYPCWVIANVLYDGGLKQLIKKLFYRNEVCLCL